MNLNEKIWITCNQHFILRPGSKQALFPASASIPLSLLVFIIFCNAFGVLWLVIVYEVVVSHM
jgi:hypothetical protein